MKRHATGQGSPVQVRSFGRTGLPLQGLPPDVQRCGQNRPEREAEEQIRSHREDLSPTEGVRLGHPREAVKGNLEGRRRRVIPGADGWKLASAMGRKVNRTGEGVV